MPEEAPTISQLLARETCQVTFDDLPDEVVHEAKRRVLDTLACTVAGSDSPPGRALQEAWRDVAGPAEATVVGSGLRTTAMQATLANGAMLRFTEAMDRSFEGPDGVVANGHPSEVIPSIIAVGERERSTGRDVITAVVLGYELLNRLSYAAGGAIAIETLGFKNEIRAALIVPLAVGKLLGLTEQQLVNAVGISGCFAGGLGIAQHELEPTTMVRNLRFPYLAHHAILAALMAKRDFEGPSRVFEGHDGFGAVMLRGRIDFDRLTRRGAEFNILHTWTKAYPVFGAMQGLAEAGVRVARESDVDPERIESIVIRTSPLVARLGGDPGTRRYPTTKETADHSAYFVTALAILDRAVHLTLEQFTPARFADPRLRRLLDKIRVVAVPEWTSMVGPNEVQISTVHGQMYECRVDHPKGHMRNPFSDTELEQKFRDLAGRLMSEERMKDVIAAVWRLDQLTDVRELARMLVTG